jgi:hypothetical protein
VLVHIAENKKDYMNTDISEGDTREKKNRALKAKLFNVAGCGWMINAKQDCG